MQIKDFEQKGMPEILKESSKKGIDLQPSQNLENNKERVLFYTGNRQLSEKLPEKVYSPQVPTNWE